MSWSPVVEAFMQLEAQRQPSPIFLCAFFTFFFEAKVLEDNSGCVGIEDVMIFCTWSCYLLDIPIRSYDLLYTS